MTETQRCESVEEYLARGGKITKLGETTPAPDSLVFEVPMEHAVLQTVSWRELERQADPEIDDPQYWNKLNAKLDEELKKIRKYLDNRYSVWYNSICEGEKGRGNPKLDSPWISSKPPHYFATIA